MTTLIRVAHAAWRSDAIESVRRGPGNAAESYAAHDERANGSDEAKRLAERQAAEMARHAGALTDPSREPPALPGIAEYDEYKQMSNPLRIVTSGVERVAARPYFASGKWRLVERVRWWRATATPCP